MCCPSSVPAVSVRSVESRFLVLVVAAEEIDELRDLCSKLRLDLERRKVERRLESMPTVRDFGIDR